MSLFTPEQLDALESWGVDVFRPNDIHGSNRQDLRGQPEFIAIDPNNPSEVDDAIRVERNDSGYVVDVAIADGSLLTSHDEIISEAIDKRHSYYKFGSVISTLLPNHIIGELNLKNGYCSALVIRRCFSSDLEPIGDVSLMPALISAKSVSYDAFSIGCLRALKTHGKLPLMASFVLAYNNKYALSELSFSSFEDDDRPVSSLGERVVSYFMVLANLSVATWAQQQSVPLIYRNFREGEGLENELRGAVSRAFYSATPDRHDRIYKMTSEGRTYTHSSSPLRRAADLVNHLQIGAKLSGSGLPFQTDSLGNLAEHFNRSIEPSAKIDL